MLEFEEGGHYMAFLTRRSSFKKRLSNLSGALDYTEVNIPMRSTNFCPWIQTPCQMRISYHVQTSQRSEEAMHRCMSPKAGGQEYPISTLRKHKENAGKTSQHINHGSVVTIPPPLSQS